MTTNVTKILVANRGEIAARIIKSMNAAGYRSVAVYSDADAQAPHVSLADQAVCIGPAPVAQSYLSVPAILNAAKITGADAVHPGYGFLSENADFAAECERAGLTFIGPSAENIRLMGDKRLAKERMLAAGVPCIPGYLGKDQSLDSLKTAAGEIGYPLMIKASAGGGGRGMRLVNVEEELESAIRSSASEASNAFGDGTLYLEKAIFGARHIEVQIVADSHGTTIHLGERDCSAQRRNQKVIEEAPSPVISDEVRQRICMDAVAAAKSIDYLGVGTVEFLLDDQGQHYFLEMNTRIQVEHPVTEMITGLDLVALQLRIAAGERLGLTQDCIRQNGHAIEARLYTEDPSEGFVPRTGVVNMWRPAAGKNIRVDAGITEGQVITSFYDPMAAKIIAWGATREDARRLLSRAVADTVLLGVEHNGRYLQKLLQDPNFAEGNITTDYLNNQTWLCSKEALPPLVCAVAAALLCWPSHIPVHQWVANGPAQWRLELDGSDASYTVKRSRDGKVTVNWDDETVSFTPVSRSNGVLRILTDSVQETFHYHQETNRIDIAWKGLNATFTEVDEGISGSQDQRDGLLRAPMAGTVLNVLIKPGESVNLNQPLFVLEAMKMELEIRAEVSGTVTSVGVSNGMQVAAGQLLAEIEDDGAEE